ncbi:hypothetical protein K4K49_006295 [Colletotrichum sp. SAR 10_70]|nr:hypothetical protein K4K50_006061 [Colletotrichum sp. SAR 10_71]KAI8163227.1 hypothetical protein K4K49_006295 [Colletotrichum sp. SAR 10_70]KAI8218380.1 hypothetical protein K4K54_010526 [Colletotrichum sp. SAR 10_86]KAI8226353.1 hypothetical protein K4K53_006089 [Colletotrichum sp. SAR 10_77]
MKLTVLTAILASSKAIASAAPEGVSFVKASSLSQRDIDNAVPLTFIGQAFIDGPNVTLTGTAETIYHQLLEINPAYNEWDFPEYRERMGALGFTKESLLEFQHAPSADASKLRKRQHTTCNPVGEEVGNWGLQCNEGLGYLGRLNGYCQAPAGRGGCARTSCSHGCGIFLCNDNPNPISVWCGNQVGDVYDIAAVCERERTSYVWSLLGQIFRDGPPAWNTVVRAQTC